MDKGKLHELHKEWISRHNEIINTNLNEGFLNKGFSNTVEPNQGYLTKK